MTSGNQGVKDEECQHGDLEFLGEQRTEYGPNRYFRCKLCDTVIVTTPHRRVYGTKKIKREGCLDG